MVLHREAYRLPEPWGTYREIVDGARFTFTEKAPKPFCDECLKAVVELPVSFLRPFRGGWARYHIKESIRTMDFIEASIPIIEASNEEWRQMLTPDKED